MNRRGILEKLLVILFWIGVWAVGAALVDKAVLLPSPVSVFARIFGLMTEMQFWKIVLLSLLRMMEGIVIAIICGVLLGFFTCRYHWLEALLSPLLTVIKVTPVASFILLALIWIGRDVVPALIAGMIVLPVVWTNISTGLRQTDQGLLEMARVYRVSPRITLRRIVIPSVMPYFLSAVQTGVGIGWKAGVAAEVLTVPTYAIGKMIYESKLYLETTDLFAWSLVVIVISLLIEKLMMLGIRRLGQRYYVGGEGR